MELPAPENLSNTQRRLNFNTEYLHLVVIKSKSSKTFCVDLIDVSSLIIAMPTELDVFRVTYFFQIKISLEAHNRMVSLQVP